RSYGDWSSDVCSSDLSEMPHWRLLIGGLVGPVGAWFYVVGFWQLYLALKPAGRPLAFAVFAGFSMSFVWVAGAFHTSFPFLADRSEERRVGKECSGRF